MPPSFWEKHFDATPEQVVGYFEKYALSQMGALVKAVVTFKTDSWIPYLLNQAALYVDFINKTFGKCSISEIQNSDTGLKSR